MIPLLTLMDRPTVVNPMKQRPLMTMHPIHRRRAGFSFTEVLFAVMVLGIGFIMVAAMFPVTIRQTASNVEDAAAANIAKGAVQALQAIASDNSLPVTSTKVPTRWAPIASVSLADAWQVSRGNYVSAQSPRYGWVALYRRGTSDQGSDSYAQVIIVAAQCRNRPQYFFEPQPNGSNWWSDIHTPKAGGYATLEPRLLTANLKRTGFVSTMTFNGPASEMPAIASGAYVIVADDNAGGLANGRIYQLGNPVNSDESLGQWELSPGADQLSTGTPFDDADLTNAKVYLLGRGYTDPATGDYTYSGPVQDIGVYTTFIRVN